MKQKLKLFVLILSFCFVSTTAWMGVFSAENFSFDMEGTIDFWGTDAINTTVDFSTSDVAQATISEPTLSGVNAKFSDQTQSFTFSDSSALTALQSWSNFGLVLEDSTEQASMSFTITNNSQTSTENMMIKLSSNTTNSSVVHATPSADFCIVPGASHTFSVHLNFPEVDKATSLNEVILTLDVEIINSSDVLSVSDYETKGFTFTTDSTTKTAILTKYSGSEEFVVVPSVVKDSSGNLYTVTEIGDYSFAVLGAPGSQEFNLSSITFPTTLTTIGNYVFHRRNDLTCNLIIPNGVTTIGNFAFRYCYNLTGVLNIPHNVTTIGNYAFESCRSLSGPLTISSSVTSIGIGSFYDCTGLTDVLEIPENIIEIGDSAFSGCSGLTGDLIIPDKVENIGASAFSGCTGLTGNLIIGASVTTIGAGVFSNCTFSSINIDDKNEIFYSKNNCVITVQDKVLTLGFNNSTIPQDEGILKIGDGAFQGCKGLVGTLTIPNSVKTIGEAAFSGCSGFTGTLTIPNSVTTINDEAFKYCTGFTGTLTIPNNVTTIGDYAFNNCTGFRGNLNVPNSVTQIGYSAFQGCTGFSGTITIGSYIYR